VSAVSPPVGFGGEAVNEIDLGTFSSRSHLLKAFL